MNYINDYQNKTDEELVSIIRKTDNPFVANILISRYDDIVKANTNKMFIFGGDSDDVFQEGRIGLYKAIKNYDIEAGSSFKTFATLCIKRQLISAIKSANRQKNYFLNNAISIDSPLDEGDDSNEFLIYLKDKTADDPSEIISKKEYLDIISVKIDNMLSQREKDVFKEYLAGKSYIEIAKKLKCKVKSVDTALSRIKRKINKLQENFDIK